MTDLYEKTEPWRPLSLQRLSAPGEFSAPIPPDARVADFEFRALVKHPLLVLHGAEKPVR